MEVETRVKVDDLQQLKSKLVKLGASFSSEKCQADTIYKRKGEEGKTQGPGDFILRIRESTKNLFTLKALTDKAGVWVEHETEISNPEEMKKILDTAGFAVSFTMTKKRIPGELQDFEICLDDIKEIGTYMEIALDSTDGASAKKRIVELLASLGFSEDKIIHKGYVAMIYETKGVRFNQTG
jgi:predicted adenylyl cyclase CyaB